MRTKSEPVEVIQEVCDLAAPEKGVTLAAAIQECARELNVRNKCYARWVSEGKLTQFAADERLNRLDTARTMLQKLLDRETDVREHLPA